MTGPVPSASLAMTGPQSSTGLAHSTGPQHPAGRGRTDPGR
jgi:hypothetical protein